MWLQKSKGKYYWYDYRDYIEIETESGTTRFYRARTKCRYVRPAKWWEVILNKLFGWQPK